MSLLFVRHGESTGNRDKMYAGHLPVALTQKGEQQAKDTAKLLEDKNISYVISSDLLRSFDTAKIIHDNLELESNIHTTDLLREIDPGEYSGTPYQQGKSIYDIAITSNNGESDKDLYLRVKQVLELIKSIKTDGNILVVGHNSFCSIMWAVLEGEKDFKKYRNSWHMENGSVREYDLQL